MQNNQAIIASQSPESDKFVIQDSELKNQQTYLSQASQPQTAEATGQAQKSQKPPDGEEGGEMGFDPESDVMLQNLSIPEPGSGTKVGSETNSQNYEPTISSLLVTTDFDEQVLYFQEMYRILFHQCPKQNIISF